MQHSFSSISTTLSRSAHLIIASIAGTSSATVVSSAEALAAAVDATGKACAGAIAAVVGLSIALYAFHDLHVLQVREM